MNFKAEARRNKLIGLWAADLMGKSAEEAEAYAREVIHADFEEAGHEDVIRKLVADLGTLAEEAVIRKKMDEFRRKSDILEKRAQDSIKGKEKLNIARQRASQEMKRPYRITAIYRRPVSTANCQPMHLLGTCCLDAAPTMIC